MNIATAVDRVVSRSGVTRVPYEQSLFDELNGAIDFYRGAPDALIQVLHRAQEVFGYMRPDVVAFICRRLRLPLAHAYGVIGFYSFFSKVPQGKYPVRVCTGTACYVRGSDQLLRGLRKELGVDVDQTTADGRFSLRCVRCVGACGLAPVIMVGTEFHGNLRTDRLKKILGRYK